MWGELGNFVAELFIFSLARCESVALPSVIERVLGRESG